MMYDVTIKNTDYYSLTVEADSAEEAREFAVRAVHSPETIDNGEAAIRLGFYPFDTWFDAAQGTDYFEVEVGEAAPIGSLTVDE